ncbi:MAG TPA: glycerophosphodiester phosphodiesterase [Capillimicrobium sp.]|nr:glycerophosphodiester phosphodiesterase [Capillimicrobium sp.]
MSVRHIRALVAALLAAAVAAALAPAAASAAKGNPWLTERFLNFAHQGGEDELPSNTMYAFKEAMKAGADALELDVGYTSDGHLVVLHDNTLDRTTNGTGSVNDKTLAEVQALDAAYWFVPGRNAVHDQPAGAYPFRGVRTGQVPPPKGYTREDFRIPTLDEVLKAFPDTPINVEIKGRDGADDAVFFRGADLLADLLNRSGRTDVIVASFNQRAIDRFHAAAPQIGVAPGIDGMASFLLSNGSPGEGVVAFQIPITFKLGDTLLTVTSPDTVRRAHEAGYAVHVWLSNDTEDTATYDRLLDLCVDGIMAARPKLLERTLVARDVGTPGGHGFDPCGTKVAASRVDLRGWKATLPLERRGLSMERRSGTVTLTARRKTVGTARFVLDAEATETSVKVKVNATGRELLRGKRSVRVKATVQERVPASQSYLRLRKPRR